MRSNEEFAAEVMRRGGERIKKRKKIKTVILTCLPLLLCTFSAFHILMRPALLSRSNAREKFSMAERVPDSDAPLDDLPDANGATAFSALQGGTVGETGVQATAAAASESETAALTVTHDAARNTVTVTDRNGETTALSADSESAKKLLQLLEELTAGDTYTTAAAATTEKTYRISADSITLENGAEYTMPEEKIVVLTAAIERAIQNKKGE